MDNSCRQNYTQIRKRFQRTGKREDKMGECGIEGERSGWEEGMGDKSKRKHLTDYITTKERVIRINLTFVKA